MDPVLAQATDAASSWTAVLAAGVIINLFIGLGVLVRMFSGKGGERQIEPTQIAAIQAELKLQTMTLNAINREIGEVKSSVPPLAQQVEGLHVRVGGISRELAATVARVDGLEKREGNKNAT
jgi:capsule polysaccharide export protein KpsE/RkpR